MATLPQDLGYNLYRVDALHEAFRKEAIEAKRTAKPPLTGFDVFATTLRDITGMIITIENGTRVRVTRQCEIDGTCTIDLMEKDNPTQIWNTIVGVPMKYLQFDPST